MYRKMRFLDSKEIFAVYQAIKNGASTIDALVKESATRKRKVSQKRTISNSISCLFKNHVIISQRAKQKGAKAKNGHIRFYETSESGMQHAYMEWLKNVDSRLKSKIEKNSKKMPSWYKKYFYRWEFSQLLGNVMGKTKKDCGQKEFEKRVKLFCGSGGSWMPWHQVLLLPQTFEDIFIEQRLRHSLLIQQFEHVIATAKK